MPITYPIILGGVQGRNILREPCRQLAYTQKCVIQLPLLFQHAKQQEVVNDCMKFSSLQKKKSAQCYQNLKSHASKPCVRPTSCTKTEGGWVTDHSFAWHTLSFWASCSYPQSQSWGTFYSKMKLIQKQICVFSDEVPVFLFALQKWLFFSEKVLGC